MSVCKDIDNENKVTRDYSNSLMRKRAGKKGLVTRKINQISTLIESNGNKTFIKHALAQLDEAMSEVEQCHDKYVLSLDQENEKVYRNSDIGIAG